MANEATQFTIGGVTHDVMDVGARQLIANLQNAINAITSGDTTTAIETFQEVINFLDGVTDDATLIGKLNELRTLINAKYTKPNTGIPASDLAESVQDTLDDVANKANSSEVIKGISVNGQAQTKDPNTGNVNIDAYTKAQTEAKIAEAVEGVDGGTVVASVDDIDIVDNVAGENGNTILSAPSARMVKEIYLNLKALFDPESGLANLAFVGQRPNWVTVAKRHYTLTFGTLEGLDSTTPVKDAEGNAVTSGTQVNEGYLKLVLVPQSASHVFTSITINGEQVTSTPTGDADGSRYIEITVAGPITLAASAVSGRAVIFTGSTGCTIDATSVQAGQSLDTTIRANKYYNLPQSIIVLINGTNTNVSHTYTPAQDGKTARLQVASADITGNLEVICIASMQTPITVSLSGGHVTFKNGNTSLGASVSVYPDDIPYTINIKPETDYALAANGITLPSGLSAVSDDDGGFNVTIDSFPSGNISIQANATSNFWEVTVPSSVEHLTVTDANDDAFDSNTQQVTKGSAFTCYIKAEFLWKANVAVTVGGSAAAEGFYTYDPATGELVIDAVTGDVVISATMVDGNVEYKNIQIKAGGSGGNYYMFKVYNGGGYLSKFVAIPNGVAKLIFTTDGANSYQNDTYLYLFDESGTFISFFSQSVQTGHTREVTLPSNAKYFRFSTLVTLLNLQIANVTDENGNTLWRYQDVNLNTASKAYDFVDKYGVLDEHRNVFAGRDNGMFIYIGPNIGSQTTLASPQVAIPSSRKIEFKCGVGGYTSTPSLICYNDDGEAVNTQAPAAGTAKTVSDIDSKYTHCRVLFGLTAYQTEEMYIKSLDDGGNVVDTLWSNADVLAQTTEE